MDALYYPVKLHLDPAARAVRQALLDIPAGQLNNEKAVLEATDALLCQYRRQLAHLQEEGWASAKGNKVQYLRNCPPTTAIVRTKKPLQPCWKVRICPWCWSRRLIYEPYNLVKDACGAESYELPYRAGKPSASKCRLRVSTLLTKPALTGKGDSSVALKLIAAYNKTLNQQTWREVHRQRATGMFGFTSIEPDAVQLSQDELWEATSEHDGDESEMVRKWRWRFVHRSLVISPANVVLEPIEGRKWHSDLLGQVELGKAFARFAKYTPSLLWANPDIIVDYLGGIKDSRLFQMFGALSMRSELKLLG